MVGMADRANKIFYKNVNSKKHLFKKSDGWAINAGLVKTLAEKDYTVEIRDEKGKVYKMTAKKMLEVGEPIHYQGFEKQIVIPRRNFAN
jgi:hypothetical protein